MSILCPCSSLSVHSGVVRRCSLVVSLQFLLRPLARVALFSSCFPVVPSLSTSRGGAVSPSIEAPPPGPDSKMAALRRVSQAVFRSPVSVPRRTLSAAAEHGEDAGKAQAGLEAPCPASVRPAVPSACPGWTVTLLL